MCIYSKRPKVLCFPGLRIHVINMYKLCNIVLYIINNVCKYYIHISRGVSGHNMVSIVLGVRRQMHHYHHSKWHQMYKMTRNHQIYSRTSSPTLWKTDENKYLSNIWSNLFCKMMCKLIAVGACVPQCATTNLWRHICKKKKQNKNTSYLWASDAQIGGNLLSSDQPPNKGSLCSSHDLQLNFMSLGSKLKCIQQHHGSKRQTKTFSAIQASSKSAWKWCFDVLDGEASKELQPFGRIGHHWP